MLKIPTLLMRAGTSKAIYIEKKYLPIDKNERDIILLKLMGTPKMNQIDGFGNNDPLSNKIAIVGPSNRNDADVDFLFAQVLLNENKVSTEANCGNILSGVAAYVIEIGLIKASHPVTTIKIYNENTDTVIESIVATPNGTITYEGDAVIDGVPGTGSPIYMNFPNSIGKTFGALLPTGSAIDKIDNFEFSFVDAAVPLLIFHAHAFGITGYESPEELSKDSELLKRIKIVREKVLVEFQLPQSSLIPKVALVSESRKNGHINSRYFTPYTCHSAHAITGGLCLATAFFIPNTIMNNFYLPSGKHETIIIEHPAGKLDVDIEIESLNPLKINRAGFMRTVRPLLQGYGMIT